MGKQYAEFQDLLLVMGTAIFMSTPHLVTSTETLAKRVLSILKLRPKAMIHRGAMKGDGLGQVVDCCQTFNRFHFEKPILSIYEVEKTAIPGMFTKKTEVFRVACGLSYCSDIF